LFFIVAAMRPLCALLIYIMAVFIGGALLAPPVYWLVQSFVHAHPEFFAHHLHKVATASFPRYVNRSLMAVALIGLWPLVKNLEFHSLPELGIVRPRGQWKKLAAGFVLGFVSLAIVAGISIAFHARQLNERPSGSAIFHRLLEAAATAIVTAILEEILFRGAIFGALRKVFHWTVALVLSSMIYAILHYFETVKIADAVTWLSGLELLPLMLRNLGDLHAVIPGFFNLTLAGMLLAWAYQRTGNLYFSVGLHMGWIFWIKAYAAVSTMPPTADKWLWGSGRMAIVNGWVALPILFATLLVFGWKTSNTQRPTPSIQ
jgi:membrane protease YdiL (CAAX protease family)